MNLISKHPALSDAEIASRAVVAANAIGSTEIEGLSVSADQRADLDAWCKARHSRD